MARQRLSDKNTRKLAALTGLPVVRVLVRGNTDHRRDLCLADGSVVHLYRDGTMEKGSTRHTAVASERST